MRCMLTLVASSWLLACSSALPVPKPVPLPVADAGPSSDAGANPEPCEGATESLAGRCLEGLGAGASCPLTPFSDDHVWLTDASTTRYVSADGDGDGQSADAPAGSIQSALAGVEGSVVVILGAGTFEVGDTLPDQLTIVGRCAAESTVSLGARGPLVRSAGQTLRLWGLAMKGDQLTGEQAIVEFTGAGVLEAFQTVWTSGGSALSVQGSVTLKNNTFGAIGANGFGVRGPLSSVIVGDNHFLGPLGGEGVFLGPLGGEGVFRVTGNTFESIAGNALTIVDAASSIVVGDNHFLGPLGGEGVFVGPAQAMVTIENNRFESVAGHALTVQEITGGAKLAGNVISAPEPGAMGAGILILDARSGAVNVTNNQVNGATNAALVVERSSAQMNITGNTLSNTALPPEVGGDEQYAFGALVLDSGNISMINNVIKSNATAGVLYDLEGWNTYLRRSDLSGACTLENRGNEYADNPINEVSQNEPPETERSTDVGAQTLPDRGEPLPTGRRSGRARCGDGEVNGAEDCDPDNVQTRSVCNDDCTLIDTQRSASGKYFSCFIGSDYQVYCIGSNQKSEILQPGVADPDPNGIQQLSPITKIELGDYHFTSVAAGRDHACAVTIEGQVICWGDRTYGQVGDCTLDMDSTAAAIVMRNAEETLEEIRSISSHENTTCAVTFNGDIFCWGAADHGQRSNNAGRACAERPGFDQPHQAADISVGNQFICARSDSGQVACWGLNTYRQLGQSSNDVCDDLALTCSTSPLVVNIPPVLSIATGRSACGMVNANNKLFCWGPTDDTSLPPTSGQGTDDPEGGVGPSRVDGVQGVSRYALGHQHGCLVDITSGDLKCWGHEPALWSGDRTQDQAISPTVVPMSNGERELAIEELTLGHGHTCTLRSDRFVRCWGYFFNLGNAEIAVLRSNGLYSRLP